MKFSSLPSQALARQRRECQGERDTDPICDARLKRELLSDEKELAEHRMPIDLARNGIGKFAALAIDLACNAPSRSSLQLLRRYKTRCASRATKA